MFRLVNAAAVLKSLLSPANDVVANEVAVPDKIKQLIPASFDKSELELLENAFKVEKKGEGGQLVQDTKLMLSFELQEIRLSLSVSQDENDVKPLLHFGMKNLSIVCAKKTFETVLDVKLQDLFLDFADHHALSEQQNTVKMINSCDSSDKLLTIHFVDVSECSSEFASQYNKVRRNLEVVMSSLVCDFQQEAVIHLLRLSNDINARIDAISYQSTSEKEEKRPETSSKHVNFRIRAQLHNFQLNLLTRKLHLARIEISGLMLDSTVRRTFTVIQAQLYKLCVENINIDTFYRKMMSLQDFELKVTVFNHHPEDVNFEDEKKLDLNIHLRIGSMRAVYLSGFVRKLVAFANHFQAAREAVVETASASVTAIKKNRDMLVKLDIEFRAPFVIFPQRSNCKNALIIDLGHFTLVNRFDLKTRDGIASKMDSITFNLRDLRIFLAEVDGMAVKQVERELIEPITFNVDLVRNLISTWYNEEPDLKVDVDLGTVSIRLSELVYGKLMHIIFTNLEEGQLDQIENPDDRQINIPAIVQESSGESPLLSTEPDDSILQPVRVFTAFAIKLEEIKMELFTVNATANEVISTAVELPLSKLAIRGIIASGQLMSDRAIQSKGTLRSISIEDTRPLLQVQTSTPGNSRVKKERQINRLLYPTEFGDPQQQMLMIDFQQDKHKVSIVDVHLCGFTLILCPSYLLRLVRFFTSGLPANRTSQSKKTASQVVPIRSNSKNTVPHTTVNIQVDKPDIFLVDRIDCLLDTSALVLNFETKLTLLLLPQGLDILGELSKLNIDTCLFDPEQRHRTRASVLRPCWLTVKAKLFEEDQSLHINIGDATFVVSPKTIALLSRVQRSMAEEERNSSTFIIRGSLGRETAGVF